MLEEARELLKINSLDDRVRSFVEAVISILEDNKDPFRVVDHRVTVTRRVTPVGEAGDVG